MTAPDLKLATDNHAAGFKIVEMLTRLPLDERRAVFERAAIVTTGEAIAGRHFTPEWVGGRNLIVLDDHRPDVGDVFAHECGHFFRGPDERDAATYAGERGATGGPANPEACATGAGRAVLLEPEFRPTLTDDLLSFSCAACGGACEVAAPVVPGWTARIGIRCRDCGAATSMLTHIRCGCDRIVPGVWTEDAQPDRAAFTCACETCGTEPVSLRIVSAEAAREDVEDAAHRLRACRVALARAARVLQRVVAGEVDRSVLDGPALGSCWTASANVSGSVRRRVEKTLRAAREHIDAGDPARAALALEMLATELAT